MKRRRSGPPHDAPASPASPFQLFSHISHIGWPQVPNPWAAGVVSVLHQLEHTQWWPSEALRARQLEQVLEVLAHAHSTVPLYRDLYDRAGIAPNSIQDWSDWTALPTVDRATLQGSGTAWRSDTPPTDHGELLQHFTSGSTGRPLHALSTTLTHLVKSALILRQHEWSGRDLRLRAAFIQEMDDGAPFEVSRPNWENATEHVAQTGPSLALGVNAPADKQLAALEAFRPAYLISYPSVVAELARHCQRHGRLLPSLRQVGTFGEVLSQGCRSLVQEAWGVSVRDIYSAKEIGPAALQCPEQEQYHVQSEAVVLEVLDEEGRECAPGEVGRIVLSSLHNFAAPLIRYEIGDYAEKGVPCVCGRGLPVLNRILGRQRNMLRYPDGTARWPHLSEAGLKDVIARGVPSVQQFQVVQHTINRVEARVVTQRPYTKDEESIVADYLRRQLGAHWTIDFSYPAAIERSKGGKYEDFVSACY